MPRTPEAPPMAGIGFELRRILQRNTLSSLLAAYAYAGIIGSGPWVLSIVGVLAVGLLSTLAHGPAAVVAQFQTTVTYLIVASLILTGPLQLSFTRFCADRLFARQNEWILRNFHGVMLLVTWLAGGLGLLAAIFLFPQESATFRLSAVAALVLLSNIWIATIFLSGMKRFRTIVALYAAGYGVSVLAAFFLRRYGLEGLMAGFVTGQALLLAGAIALMLREFPSERFVSFEFFDPRYHHRSLVWTGLVYYLAVWADKLIFWYWPPTSEAVIGPLRASVIYDLPIFLAYLAIIPGMAAFLVRIETDFAECYADFYDAVREGGTLAQISQLCDAMILAARNGIVEIIKIQAITSLLVICGGESLLRLLGFSPYYLAPLVIMVVAASVQVVLMGVLNVFFYLDRRREALGICLLFLGLNVVLTLLSLHLGPAYYGYGFAGANLAAAVAALIRLDRVFGRLEYDTFMRQGA
jgi:uncharacterized membrane protein